MKKSDPFIIAAWAAVIFGVLEGIVLDIGRAFPVILAPYKTSAHVLWVAPVIDLALYLIAAAGMLFLGWLVNKWVSERELLLNYGFFSLLGFLTVLTAPKIIHPIGAIVLSFGLTVFLLRRIRGSEVQLIGFLRHRLIWIPIIIGVLALGVTVYEQAHEAWLYRQVPPAPVGAPNVLLIVMDTVRYDRFTQTGGASLTPNIDRLAGKGVRFENAWPTTSWTLPSHASMLTGRYPIQHDADWPNLKLNDKYPTLGEFFTQRGYVTGAFSGNSAWVTPEYLGRGFLRFNVYIAQDYLRRTSLGRIVNRGLQEFGYHYAGLGKKAPQSNSQFLKFLDDYPGRPFFVLINYMDVNQAFHHEELNHGFWEQNPPVQKVINAYNEGLHVLDSQIGDLFDELDKRGILNNTLVIITSDHGESFGAQNTEDHDPAGHGTSLYEEQLRVPLFVIFPGHVPAGGVVTDLVSLRQIPATIVQLLGLKDSPFSGVPFPFPGSGTKTTSNDNTGILVTLNYNDAKIQSVIWNNFQYIKNLNNAQKGEELYNLSNDPLEVKNLASKEPTLPLIRKKLQVLLDKNGP
jgi:arylsulfatase A-like enzyme